MCLAKEQVADQMWCKLTEFEDLLERQQSLKTYLKDGTANLLHSFKASVLGIYKIERSAWIKSLLEKKMHRIIYISIESALRRKTKQRKPRTTSGAERWVAGSFQLCKKPHVLHVVSALGDGASDTKTQETREQCCCAGSEGTVVLVGVVFSSLSCILSWKDQPWFWTHSDTRKVSPEHGQYSPY